MDTDFSVAACVRQAEECFQRGIPAIVSLHSINFHSSVKDFRSGTLARLDEFLSALQRAHSDLMYLHDEDLCQLVNHGSCETPGGTLRVNVTKKTFIKAMVRASG
jgi:delta-aminolevulinic acid dehydratase/porphobilinogen synthase